MTHCMISSSQGSREYKQKKDVHLPVKLSRGGKIQNKFPKWVAEMQAKSQEPE